MEILSSNRKREKCSLNSMNQMGKENEETMSRTASTVSTIVIYLASLIIIHSLAERSQDNQFSSESVHEQTGKMQRFRSSVVYDDSISLGQNLSSSLSSPQVRMCHAFNLFRFFYKQIHNLIPCICRIEEVHKSIMLHHMVQIHQENQTVHMLYLQQYQMHVKAQVQDS